MDEKRPSNVIWFERLMYLSIAIGIANTALNWNRLVALTKRFGGVVFGVYVYVGAFAVMVSLIWLVARQAKNWARWLQLSLFVLGIPSDARLVGHNLHDRPMVGALELVSTVLQVAALYLIFTGNAREWFMREAA
jgi:hypothetical protein